jgi:hypothetical protein
MALKLFVSLPKEAREALWQIETMGNWAMGKSGNP